ncbi:hypothetical protein CDCA_CDCA05G1642 [Cyanidium caldarium]|uniref:Uncharacterized protein n=1 Tax=Cyanidium caldarium TaxID=2771 RepID=A0AAV9ITH0_CYACA|nr:hypothetical protein CDCA_CDCA05G1642 [Cyanidium caldarium]
MSFGEQPSDGRLVYALDFDGVLCDSVDESSRSAYRAALLAFPERLKGPRWTGRRLDADADPPPAPSDAKAATTSSSEDAAAAGRSSSTETATRRVGQLPIASWLLQVQPPQWMLNAMRKLRPVIETGYENVLLVRLLAEEHMAAERSERGMRPLTVGEIAANWQSLLHDKLLRDWGLDATDVAELFARVRDDWIERDLSSWVQSSPLYPGVADALNLSQETVYVVTTKNERFVRLLLEHGGVRPERIPPERIYGLDRRMSKIGVLKEILRREEAPREEGAASARRVTVHFVEDRVETLESASLSLLGAPIQYYMAMWGYHDASQQARAERHPFIHLLDLPTFTMKLR